MPRLGFVGAGVGEALVSFRPKLVFVLKLYLI